ncbi:MAG: lycopene cyclase domain-containing protein [Candidatus Nanopelagicales bacterium]|jgi:lycopene cyclase domain-containing protein|nr:lycopene cyclase domain-containing protein [Candidatus Nanopelagicales bacterium]
MAQWSYLAVMAFIFLGTAWLEVGLRTRVYRRWRRLLLSVLPAAAVFYCWDVYAIGRGHWWFDEERITGLRLLGGVPVDELVFFLLVPVAAVLTLEAVRSASGLPVGDEPAGQGGAAVGRDGAPAGPTAAPVAPAGEER